MAIRKIARMGHPVLRRVSEAVADATAPEVRRLAADLIDTCEDIGGNGIAAPQVYEPLRLFGGEPEPDSLLADVVSGSLLHPTCGRGGGGRHGNDGWNERTAANARA